MQAYGYFSTGTREGLAGPFTRPAFRLAVLMRRSSAAFIVNDHPDIAMAVDADGVHLGQDDLPVEEARKLMGAAGS